MSSPFPAPGSTKVEPVATLEKDHHTTQMDRDEQAATNSQSSINEDDKQMVRYLGLVFERIPNLLLAGSSQAAFGYKSQLARRWHTLESFAVSFCAM